MGLKAYDQGGEAKKKEKWANIAFVNREYYRVDRYRLSNWPRIGQLLGLSSPKKESN